MSRRLPGNSLPITPPSATRNETNLSQAGNRIISNNMSRVNVNTNVSNLQFPNTPNLNLNFSPVDFAVSTDLPDQRSEFSEVYEETYNRELTNINRSLLSSYEYNDIVLDLMFDITGNDLNDESQPIQKINSIANIKNSIIDKLFQNCESQFKSVLKKTNSYQFVIDTIKEKVENTEELKLLFEEGLVQRDDTINALDYSAKFNKFIIDRATGTEFCRISNYFIDTYRRLENNEIASISIKKDIFSFEENDPISRVKLNIDNEYLSKYLMISYEGYNDISRTIDFTKIVVQNIINNVRSMFTLMPNCMKLKEDPTTSRLFVEYKNDDEIVYKVERSDFKLWKFIDNNGKLNYDDFVFENSNVMSSTNNIIPIKIIESNIEEENLKAKSIESNQFGIEVESIGSNQFRTNIEEYIEGYVVYEAGSTSLTSSNTVNTAFGSFNTGNINLQNRIKNTRVDSRRLKVTPESSITVSDNLIRLQNINLDGSVSEISNSFKILKSNNNTNTLFNKILISQILKPSRESILSVGGSISLILQFTTNDNAVFKESYLLHNIENHFFNTQSHQNFTDRPDSFFIEVNNPIDVLRDYTNTFPIYDGPDERLLDDTRLLGEYYSFFENPIVPLYFKHAGSYNLYYKYKPLIVTDNNSKIEIKTQEASHISFNKEKFVLKLDSFIKRIKLDHLASKEIDISAFNDVLKNLKNSKNNYLMKSYLKNDKDSIAILNSENKLYQFMFDENEDFDSSNLSYSMKSHIDKNVLYTSATTPIYEESIADNINDIFSNYYPENDYFSSTKFLESVIGDFQAYISSFSNDSSYKKNLYVTDILYLNYFSENNEDSKEDTKNEIVKRFLLETLKDDVVSSSRLKNQKLKKYMYNNKSFDTIVEDFNKLELPSDTSSLDIRKSLRDLFSSAYDEYRSSSSSLDTIHKEIFSNRYFNFIKEEYNLSLANINYYNNKIFKIEQTFPFYHEVFIDRVYNLNKENAKRKIKLNKNLYPVWSTYIDEDSVKLTLNFDNLNYFTNGNIHLNTVILNLNVEEGTDSIVSKNSVKNNITDSFERNMNDSSSIFYKIKNKIKALFRQTLVNYEDLYFSNEEEMSSFIGNNPKLTEYVLELVELYSEIFVDVSKKINFDFNTKLFSQIVDPYFSGDSSLLIDKNAILDAEISESYYVSHFNSFSFTQESLSIFNKKEGRQGRVFNYTVSEAIKQYYSDLMSIFTKEDFSLEDEVISNSNNQFNSAQPLYIQKTNEDSFCQKMHEVISMLKKSDYYQAVSFDLTREMLRTSKNITDNIEKINNESLIELANKLEENEDEFFRNINNSYYRNILNKNIYNVLTRNKEISEGVIDRIESENDTLSLEDSLSNISIFDKYKSEYKYKNVNLNDDIIYAFSLPYNKLQNINDDTLIKITFMPKDLVNSNRLFYPIIFYFSTNILQTNFNILNGENNFKYYENSGVTKNLATHNTDFDQTNENMSEYLRQIIIRKLSPKTDEELENYLNNIIESHKRSIELNKLLYIKHDINLEKKKSVGSEVLSLVSERLSDNAVRNIFDVEKFDIINNFSDFENSLNSISLMNDSLNHLLSIEKDNEELFDTATYDKYLVSLDRDSLIYNDVNEPKTALTEFDFSLQNTYNKTSLYEIANKHQTEYVFDRYETIDISEREFLTFIVKTEILWKV